MKMNWFVAACVLIVALMATRCGKVRHPNYYTLALAPTLAPAGDAGHALGTLAVRDFEIAAYLRQGRIVYRESPTQVGFYEYHRWVTNPSATATTAIIDSLRTSGLFSQVDSDAKHIKSDFLLTGKLERLDEIDYAGTVRVEVKLSARLVNLRTASLVWSGDEAETAKVEKATVDSVVVGMSHAAQKCIERLLASLTQQLITGSNARSSPAWQPGRRPAGGLSQSDRRNRRSASCCRVSGLRAP
jgi:ABC-type uncharacterized transport system auxiliary subunit